MKPSTPTRATVLVGGLFVVSLLSGAWTGAAAAARAQDPYAELELFARAFTLVHDNYVDEKTDEELVAAAIRGMISELDPHSRWLTAEEYADFREDAKGSYEGIGVEVRRVEAGVLVARVLAGGPAERDGLQAGDRILAVDGESLAGFDLDQVSEKLKGPRGEPVVLTVQRDGWEAPREVRTVRDRVHTPSVLAEKMDDGVVYARLVQFQEGTGRELERALEDLAPTRGIVLDLRDNPGGLLEEAVSVSDLFLDDGVVVSTQSRVEGRVEHTATPGGVSPELEVVLLVNGMSASASEIVAGALQDTGRAVLVGTRTYGKGTVQTLYRNPDDSALKLTIGRYYTPSGDPVADRNGREPDHVVEAPALERPATEQLRERIGALEIPEDEKVAMLGLLSGIRSSPSADTAIPWDRPATERLGQDPQLRYALELLR